MGRRCVTPSECLGIKKPIPANPSLELDVPLYPYFPFDKECRISCPEGHEQVNKTCGKCPNNLCTKVCKGAKIVSIAEAQAMDGCVIIKGTLEIAIQRDGGQSGVVAELEKFLAKIEEIEGQLKVARSDPLLSLSFLKSLKVIRGINSQDNNAIMQHSLILMENENMQDIFGENQTVQILNGQLNFHSNPKLCINKIERLRPMLAKHIPFDLESFRSSNGDRVACDLTKLNVTLAQVTSRSVKISWTPLALDDMRSLLGYVLHHKVAPAQNVTLLDGRDACGFDSWYKDDAKVDQTWYIYFSLEPYTQYAFYLKTVQLASSQTGGESDIIYFTTKPDQPTSVRNAVVKESSSDSVTIGWDPPQKPNGNLTTYIVWVNLTMSDPPNRNYCIESKWI